MIELMSRVTKYPSVVLKMSRLTVDKMIFSLRPGHCPLVYCMEEMSISVGARLLSYAVSVVEDALSRHIGNIGEVGVPSSGATVRMRVINAHLCSDEL